MKGYQQILVCGSIAFDEIMDYPGRFVDQIQPDKLHQINLSFNISHLEQQLGGTATNIAYNLSLFTKKKIIPISVVGRNGRVFINFFKKHGIDYNHIIINKGKYTATGKAIADLSNNQIWGYYYGPLSLAKKKKLAKIANLNSILILSATADEAFLAHQYDAISLKIDYMYDPGMTLPWIKKDDLRNGIIHAKWLIGNDYEISLIYKKTGFKMTDLLVKNIAIITTQGENGVIYQDKLHKRHVPGYKVKKIIDPTGAGDAWRGGFISAIVEGKSAVDALIQGNAIASFAIEKYGTVNHQPTRKQIEDRMSVIKKCQI